MNDQQKLLLLTAVVGASAIGLLLLLSRRGEKDFQNGDEEETKFEDLPSEETIETAPPTVVRLEVPRYAVGAIIGKGGLNIQQLAKQTATRLEFLEDGEEDGKNERILEIKGDNDGVSDAEIKIRQMIANIPPTITLEMWVPQDSCGRLIGKGGKTIRALCQISGSKIIVDRTGDRNVDRTRRVTLTGTTQQVEHAKRLVNEHIAADKIHGRKLPKIANQGQQQQQHESPYTLSRHPKLSLPETDGYFEVFVSAFDNPTIIYIQLIAPESTKLDQLVEDMTSCYSDEAGSGDSVKEVSIGEIYGAPCDFDESWYRACVTEVDSVERMAVVYYIDFGDTGKVALDKLRCPKPEFLELEAQAIKCHVAGIQPKGGMWSDDAIKRFEVLSQCAQWSVLMARQVGYQVTANEKVPSLVLVDTNHDEEINLAEAMIREGHAESSLSINIAGNERINGKEPETANNNAPKDDFAEVSKVPKMTIVKEEVNNEESIPEVESAQNVTKEEVASPPRLISQDKIPEEVVESPEVMSQGVSSEKPELPEVVSEEVMSQEVLAEEVMSQEVMSTEECAEPTEPKGSDAEGDLSEFLQNNQHFLSSEDLNFTLTPSLVDNQDPESPIPDSIPQSVQQLDTKRYSACSLSSASTEDTVIQVKSLPKDNDNDVFTNTDQSDSREPEAEIISDQSASDTSKLAGNDVISDQSASDTSKIAASDVISEQSAQETSKLAGSEIISNQSASDTSKLEGSDVIAVTENERESSHHKKVKEEVNKWIASSLEHENDTTMLANEASMPALEDIPPANEASVHGNENMTVKTNAVIEASESESDIAGSRGSVQEGGQSKMADDSGEWHPNRLIFQNSMELSKENPILLSDDDDSLSYMSARSELTIADTEESSYRSAPTTPTNPDSFEYLNKRDSTLDYDIITTPVGSDDEFSPPDIFKAAPLEATTVKTPKYQIRIVEETPTPTRNGSLDALSSSNNREEAGRLSSSPQRIGKLSASTPQFGELVTSQSRFGGSGSIGKETSI